MIIRGFNATDLAQLKEIHERFYQAEFSFGDFCSQFIDFFVVEEDGSIIAAGGVRAIAESVIMTNKDKSPRLKRSALIQMLQAQMFTCNHQKFTQLHAFVQEGQWKQHLLDFGFAKCKGEALFIEVK